MSLFKKQTAIDKTLATSLSNENWGVSGTAMAELADATKDAESYASICAALWKTLKLPPKNWRQIFKALTIVEHLIKNGAAQFIDDARSNVLYMNTLQEFSFKEGQLERGQGIREKSRQIVELLDDDDRIRMERKKAKELRAKLSSRETSVGSGPVAPVPAGRNPAPIKKSTKSYDDDDEEEERPKKKTAKKSKKVDYDDFDDDEEEEKPKKKTAKKVVKKAAPVSGDFEDDEEEEKPKKKVTKKAKKVVEEEEEEEEEEEKPKKKVAKKAPVKKAAAKKSKKAVEEEEEEDDGFGFDVAAEPAAEPAADFDDVFGAAPAPAAAPATISTGGLDDVFGASVAPAPMAASPMAVSAPAPEPKKKSKYDDLFSLDNLGDDTPATSTPAKPAAKAAAPMNMNMGYGMPQQQMSYGMPQQQMGYGMPQQMGYGMPQQQMGMYGQQQMNGMYRGY